MSKSRAVIVAGILAAIVAVAWTGIALGHSVERVSVGAGGAPADSHAWHHAISGDGRYVAFSTAASNLVPGDTNGREDVFVRDRQSGATERVSVGPGGVQSNGESSLRALSPDGRYVVFQSGAGNLVPGDTNGIIDVFVRDRQMGTTERVSVGTGGTQANGAGYPRGITADGRYVVFTSDATNLVPGDTNGVSDVFIRDCQPGTTERVSVATSGAQANSATWDCAISANGRYVAFQSSATNLVSGDTNRSDDVFVRDRQTGTTSRVSVRTGGAQANASSYGPSGIGADRYIAFSSDASNLVTGDTNGARDAFVHDLQTGSTVLVSVSSAGATGNRSSGTRSISGDGRYVAFVSYATNLVSGDTNGRMDVFVHDRQTGTTQRVSVDDSGRETNGTLYFGAQISADGRYVAFDSDATDLLPGGVSGASGIFVVGPLGKGVFSDISFSPYEDAIGGLAEAGVIGGYIDGTFRPDNLVLRRHFAKMIVGALSLPVTESAWQDADPPFTDCGPDDPDDFYPHDFIAVAKTNGLTAGKTATTFAPDANITRAQMVTMVVRAAQLLGVQLREVRLDFAGEFALFYDPTHGENARLAEHNGLLAGLVVYNAPSSWMAGNATRGEVAQVLWNLMTMMTP